MRQCSLEKHFLDVKIFANRNYAVSVIASMVLYLVMMGSSVMMPLYVQCVMGYSAVVSGLVTLPGSLATAIVSPLAGSLYDRIGIKKIFVTGSAALVISNIEMYFLTMSTPLWTATALNVIRNIAIGSLMMPLLTWGDKQCSSGENGGCFLSPHLAAHDRRLYRIRCICRDHDRREHSFGRRIRRQCDDAWHECIVSLDDGRRGSPVSDIRIRSPRAEIKGCSRLPVICDTDSCYPLL